MPQQVQLPPQISSELVANVLAHLGSIGPAGMAISQAAVAPDPSLGAPAIQPNIEVVAMLEQISTRLDNIEKDAGNNRRRTIDLTDDERDGRDGDDEGNPQVDKGRQRKKKKRQRNRSV